MVTVNSIKIINISDPFGENRSDHLGQFFYGILVNYFAYRSYSMAKTATTATVPTFWHIPALKTQH